MLQADAASVGAWLEVVNSDLTRQAIAELVVRGDRLQMANPDFRRELAAGIHPDSSPSHDGIPGSAYGVDRHLDFATPIFAWAMRTFDLGDAVAHHNRQLVMQSPTRIGLSPNFIAVGVWL